MQIKHYGAAKICQLRLSGEMKGNELDRRLLGLNRRFVTCSWDCATVAISGA